MFSLLCPSPGSFLLHAKESLHKTTKKSQRKVLIIVGDKAECHYPIRMMQDNSSHQCRLEERETSSERII